ncbi:hypothetical protein PTT_19334, partial [Pyrenophora teres f. teres 0-1]
EFSETYLRQDLDKHTKDLQTPDKYRLESEYLSADIGGHWLDNSYQGGLKGY